MEGVQAVPSIKRTNRTMEHVRDRYGSAKTIENFIKMAISAYNRPFLQINLQFPQITDNPKHAVPNYI